MCKTEPPRGTLCLMPSLKTNKRRHPNNSVGMGKMSKINKRRAYCYSEVKSTYLSDFYDFLAKKLVMPHPF